MLSAAGLLNFFSLALCAFFEIHQTQTPMLKARSRLTFLTLAKHAHGFKPLFIERS